MMSQNGNGKAFQFAKSRAKMVKGNEKKVTFADVAGLDEENRNWKKLLISLNTQENTRTLEQGYQKAYYWLALREQERHMCPKRPQVKRECLSSQ